ncbi:MAG TPA: mycofactocin-coupled SDR family oxidoreductase [Mycobacteriales bacterium]|nr:mycofactocin-coupled SDR family oxidoreductase [Mycobacteriales bacterium]
MTQRVAVVTGAARGIGAATVRRLAADGWAVVALDLGGPSAADGMPYEMATRDELESLRDAGEVTTIFGDVRNQADLAQAVDIAETKYGGLDAALGIAGIIGGGAPQWELAADLEQLVLDVDLGGVLKLARVAVPALLRRSEPRDGRFLAVASAAATRGLPMLAAYCAAKSGVAGLIRSLAVELRGTGVTANAVSPGSTQTKALEASAKIYGLDDVIAFADQQPLNRLLQPEEVAAMLVWLAGPEATGLTGAIVPVDGGLAL